MYIWWKHSTLHSLTNIPHRVTVIPMNHKQKENVIATNSIWWISFECQNIVLLVENKMTHVEWATHKNRASSIPLVWHSWGEDHKPCTCKAVVESLWGQPQDPHTQTLCYLCSRWSTLKWIWGSSLMSQYTQSGSLYAKQGISKSLVSFSISVQRGEYFIEKRPHCTVHDVAEVSPSAKLHEMEANRVYFRILNDLHWHLFDSQLKIRQWIKL